MGPYEKCIFSKKVMILATLQSFNNILYS